MTGLRVVTDLDARVAEILALRAALAELARKRDVRLRRGDERIALGALDEVCALAPALDGLSQLLSALSERPSTAARLDALHPVPVDLDPEPQEPA